MIYARNDVSNLANGWLPVATGIYSSVTIEFPRTFKDWGKCVEHAYRANIDSVGDFIEPGLTSATYLEQFYIYGGSSKIPLKRGISKLEPFRSMDTSSIFAKAEYHFQYGTDNAMIGIAQVTLGELASLTPALRIGYGGPAGAMALVHSDITTKCTSESVAKEYSDLRRELHFHSKSSAAMRSELVEWGCSVACGVIIARGGFDDQVGMIDIVFRREGSPIKLK